MSDQYNAPPGPPPQQQQQQQPQYPPYPQQNQPPYAPPQRTGTDAGLPTGQDRTEQMETFQAYEASKPQSQEDQVQETLQKEFPSLDSSLIMAIWNDSKDLSQTRELLQELTSGTGS